MNKINQRVQSNSKLLTILCKRDSNKTLTYRQNQWPGKRRLSFAVNIRIKKQTPTKKVQISERKSNSLYRKSSKKTLMRTNQITSSAKSLSLLPKKDYLRSIKQAEIHKFDTESERQLGSLNNEVIKSYISKKTQRDELNDYVIDYIAFNYIGKVIDNPELWQKFVHKKLAL